MLWIYLLVTIAVVVVGFLLVASRQPETFRVERSLVMAAPPERPFALVNDFHLWPEWSPWVALDPNVVYTYSGAEAGEGAEVHWVGNSKAGEGHMTVLESTQSELVRIKLQFLKPFAALNTADFTFTPGNGQTNVIWTMHGDKNLMMKAFHMVMNMDKMVGGDFERGLAKMKSIVEAS